MIPNKKHGGGEGRGLCGLAVALGGVVAVLREPSVQGFRQTSST